MEFKKGSVVSIKEQYLKDYSKRKHNYDYIIDCDYISDSRYMSKDTKALEILKDVDSFTTIGINKNEFTMVYYDINYPNNVICKYIDYVNNECYLSFPFDVFEYPIKYMNKLELIANLQEMCAQL